MALSPNVGRPAKNRYDVIDWYWASWSNAQRSYFNRFYASLRQEEIVPVQIPLLSKAQWRELRTNIAIAAADALV